MLTSRVLPSHRRSNKSMVYVSFTVNYKSTHRCFPKIPEHLFSSQRWSGIWETKVCEKMRAAATSGRFGAYKWLQQWTDVRVALDLINAL